MASAPATFVDPVTVQIVGSHLLAITEEMEIILVKAAYSTNIKERRDCSTAVLDPEGNVMAQGQHNPMHLGAVAGIVQEVRRRFSLEEIRPGDVFIANDPYCGGNTHVPDVAIAAPFFLEGRLIGFTSNAAHHAEIGGSPAVATDIYTEGVRIPAVRLYHAGELNRDVLDLLLLNTRLPGERLADLRAQVAAARNGLARLEELFREHGTDTVLAAVEALYDQTERQLRAAVRAISPGRYEFEDWLDDDGAGTERIPIRVAVIVDGDCLTFDFSGSAPQVPGGVNLVLEGTRAVVQYVVKAVIEPTMPANSGFTRAITIVAPPGSITCSRSPAPTLNRSDTAQRLVDVCFGALAQALPQRVIAASNGAISGCQFFGPHAGGYYSYLETIGGGMGARPDRDGVDGVQVHMTNTSNLPVEALEVEYPLRVERHELVQDSGGPGRFRGGMGLRRVYAVLEQGSRLRTKGDRHCLPPWGLAGGLPGATGEYWIEAADGSRRRVASKAYDQPLEPGDRVTIQTAGAGGHGPVAQRARESVLRDLLEERISPEAAEMAYGVRPEPGELEKLARARW